MLQRGAEWRAGRDGTGRDGGGGRGRGDRKVTQARNACAWGQAGGAGCLPRQRRCTREGMQRRCIVQRQQRQQRQRRRPCSPVAALDAEHAVAADLVQCVSNHLAHAVVVASTDGGDVLRVVGPGGGGMGASGSQGSGGGGCCKVLQGARTRPAPCSARGLHESPMHPSAHSACTARCR
jgi:hypothetical protein